MKIEVPKSVIDEIFSHALEEYPGECCGWIIEDNDKTLHYTKAENLQDKYHKLDPESYPRTSKDAFLINSLKLSKAVESAVSNGGKLFSIVHSHIECGAYFSQEDEKQMSLPDGTDQVFPSHCYIVVSIEEKKPSQTAVFVYEKDSKKFAEASLIIT